jgi:hypothetical protein
MLTFLPVPVELALFVAGTVLLLGAALLLGNGESPRCQRGGPQGEAGPGGPTAQPSRCSRTGKDAWWLPGIPGSRRRSSVWQVGSACSADYAARFGAATTRITH